MTLSYTAKTDLSQLLVHTAPDPLIIAKIEATLGIYADGKRHLDNPPRPADYVRAFASLEKKARKLSEELFDINYYYAEHLSIQGVDCFSIAPELNKLAEISRKACAQFAKQPSTGRGENSALMVTILHLRRIFHKYYRGARTVHGASRAPALRGTEDDNEEQFVRTALDAANIECSDLRRLMGDPRSTPS
ncbi:MAG: hypothetical protein HY661_03900 [Betaproteobacteria bacterium]|nr:hypothetical protein [Betaproteobacteria bacterium]